MGLLERRARRRWHRSWAALLVGTGSAFAGTGAFGWVHAAHADVSIPSLGTYSLIGDSTGVIASEDEPSANAHPEGQGSAPETSSLLTNGPVGYGLSAVGWPGATEASAGGLVILLFPGPLGNQTQAVGVPFPDALTALVDQNAALANYPVRAEARTGSQPDASYSQPGTDLRAHADAGRVDATAHLNGARQPGQASYGDTRTRSTSTLAGNVGRVESSSSVSNINLAGVVTIGSVTSSATAKTDGVSSSGAGTMAVSDMRIGGQPAYVDGNGVHVGTQGQDPNPVADQIAQQALTGAGMKIVVSKPIAETRGPTTTYNSGSLIFIWTPPGDKSNNVFTASFGGSRAAVTATPGSPFVVPSIPALAAPPAATPPVLIEPPANGSVSAVTPGPPFSTTPVAAPLAGRRHGTGLGTVLPAATFGGINWAWILLGLVGVALVFLGSKRLASDLLDRPSAACPLEATP